jgi:hypothetical protein
MRSNLILGALAVTQTLAVIASWSWTAAQVPPAPRALLQLSVDSIRALDIYEDSPAQAPSASLIRADGVWRIGSDDGPPADPSKVKDLFARLQAVQVRRPVSTSPDSHAQLKVDDEAFSRRVTLHTDADTLRWTLGGGRRNFVRVNDEPTVWDAGDLAPFRVSARPVDYLPQPYTSFDHRDVTGLVIADGDRSLQLHKEGIAWKLSPEAEGLRPNPKAIDHLLEQLASLRAAALPEQVHADLEGPTLTWTLDGEDASHLHTLTIGPERNGRRPVRSSDRDYAVEVFAWAVEPLLEASVETLSEPTP